MFRVMVPILDPASGRFLHHLRQGKALLSLAVAKRKADREQRTLRPIRPLLSKLDTGLSA